MSTETDQSLKTSSTGESLEQVSTISIKPESQVEEEEEEGEGPVEASQEAEDKPGKRRIRRPVEKTKDEEVEVKFPGEDDEDEDDDFRYYSKEELKAKPLVMGTNEYGDNLLTFIHSFGYDCQMRANLAIIDETSLVYASGNYMHFFNLETEDIIFLETLNSTGIGHFAVHPTNFHLAVTEKGSSPAIYVYDYPSMKLWRILKGGAERCYSFVTFNSSGRLLASVSSDPDYMLCVWHWRKETIILRAKAFFNDIYTVAFSSFNSMFLTTGGISHIRFWKMGKTFTGLKLQGQIGRFGRTEVSNIYGLMQFPDGKVLTGCDWGNLLIWDGALIKVEVKRRMGKTCHQGQVSQFLMDEGEILSVGTDGYIKVWQMENLDSAEPLDEQGKFELEPLNETCVGEDVSLVHIIKANQPYLWFAQDGHGAVWKLDLSFSHTSKIPQRLLSAHSGQITGMAVSPISHLFATVGIDHTVRLYDILAKKQLAMSKFSSEASFLLWVPSELHSKGGLFVVGFYDGTIRVISVDASVQLGILSVKLILADVKKPHLSCVTRLAFDVESKILATGSDDKTIFFFLWGVPLVPVGFINVNAAVSSLCWTSAKIHPKTLLVCCKSDEILEVSPPDTSKKALSTNLKKKSYLLEGLIRGTYNFVHIKERLRDKYVYLEDVVILEKESIVKLTPEELKLRRESQVAEEFEEEEEEVEEVTEPEELDESEVKKKIIVPPLCIMGFYNYKSRKFWLSMDGEDSGYLYQNEFKQLSESSFYDEPQMYSVSPDPSVCLSVGLVEDLPLRSICFSKDGKFVAMGFDKGYLQICKLVVPHNLTQVNFIWFKSVDDCDKGSIKFVNFSYDNRYLMVGSTTGSLQCFKFGGYDSDIEDIAHYPVSVSAVSSKGTVASEEDDEKEEQIEEEEEPISEIDRKFGAKLPIPTHTKENVVDITDPDHLSIEEEKQKQEYNKHMGLVAKKKSLISQQIRQLQLHFQKLGDANKELPKRMQLTPDDLLVCQNLRKELLKSFRKLEQQTYKELSWEVEYNEVALRKINHRFKKEIEWEVFRVKQFNGPITVPTYRLAKLHKDILGVMAAEDEESSRLKAKQIVKALDRPRPSLEKGQSVDIFQKTQASPISFLDKRVTRILRQIEEKRKKRAERKAEWDAFMTSKPEEKESTAKEMERIEQLSNDMGDYKLKSSPDYTVPDHLRITTKKKLKELMQNLVLTHNYKNTFNQKIMNLRNKKLAIIEKIKEVIVYLEEVQPMMKPPERKDLPIIPHMEPFELPERALNPSKETLLSQAPEDHKALIQKLPVATNNSPPKPGTTTESESAAVPKMRRDSVTSVRLATPAAEEEENLIDMDPATILASKPVKTPLELKLEKMDGIRNIYKQNQLMTEVETSLLEFDKEVANLLQEKRRLDVAFKEGDTRQLILYKELEIINKFEGQEFALLDRLNQKTEEKTDFLNKIQEMTNKIEMKRKEMERLQEQLKQVKDSLQMTIGEHNKFTDFLTKVFKKKVRRVKKREGAEGEEEIESESSESDDDVSDEDEDDEFINDQVCPDGCDIVIFNNVHLLREKRVDVEELIADEKKGIEFLKKEIDSYNKKLKAIEAVLKTVQAEFKGFQQEKQRCLNEINVVIPLKMSQIQYLVDEDIPEDLSSCLVFPAKGLVALENRIKELQQEKNIQRQKEKSNYVRHAQLIKDCKLMAVKISKLEKKCQELMVEKFGRLVDLEILENFAINRSVEELRNELSLIQLRNQQQLGNIKKREEAAENELMKSTKKNTERILGASQLLGEKWTLKTNMKKRLKQLPRDLLLEKKPDEEAECRLKFLVEKQAEEIFRLKKQLDLFKRKDYSFTEELVAESDYSISELEKKVCKRPAEYLQEVFEEDEEINIAEVNYFKTLLGNSAAEFEKDLTSKELVQEVEGETDEIRKQKEKEREQRKSRISRIILEHQESLAKAALMKQAEEQQKESEKHRSSVDLLSSSLTADVDIDGNKLVDSLSTKDVLEILSSPTTLTARRDSSHSETTQVAPSKESVSLKSRKDSDI